MVSEKQKKINKAVADKARRDARTDETIEEDRVKHTAAQRLYRQSLKGTEAASKIRNENTVAHSSRVSNMDDVERKEFNIRHAQNKANSIVNETPEQRSQRMTNKNAARKRKVESSDSDSETETAVTRKRTSSIPSGTSPGTSEALLLSEDIEQPLRECRRIVVNNQKATISDIASEIDANIDRWRTYRCSICSVGQKSDKVPLDVPTYKCPKCQQVGSGNYFANDGNPGLMPEILRQNMLTFIEEQLIALVCVNQYVYVRGKGAVVTNGHCINFAQDISEIATILPRIGPEVPVVVIRKKGTKGVSQDLKVRRQVVTLWLNWLKTNSPIPGYRNLTISVERLNTLPESGPMEGLCVLETEEDIDMDTNLQVSEQNNEPEIGNDETVGGLVASFSSHSIQDNEEMDTGVGESSLNPEIETGVPLPNETVSNESDSIANALSRLMQQPLRYPTVATEPLSEYNTPYLASMAFPTLFPLALGDPFGADRYRNSEKFLSKIKYLLFFCELIGGKKVFRFAKHSRFDRKKTKGLALVCKKKKKFRNFF